jgi:hypothetical protein
MTSTRSETTSSSAMRKVRFVASCRFQSDAPTGHGQKRTRAAVGVRLQMRQERGELYARIAQLAPGLPQFIERTCHKARFVRD